MDAAKQQKVVDFCGITGADFETAKFYLEAAGWNTEGAASQFFEAGGDASPQRTPQTQPQHQTQPQPQHNQPQSQPQHQPTGEKPKPAASGARGKGVRTLGDMGNEDVEKEQSFYTGGHSSGQMVVDPKQQKKPADTKEMVNSIFEEASRNGAQDLSPDDFEKEKNRQERPENFGGQGFRLGNSYTPTMPVTPAAKKPAAEPQEAYVTITFWVDGFTVDDGPLRRFDDPANQEFMEEIKKGYLPPELKNKGRQVNVNLVDKSTEKYVPPKVVLKPFSGSGYSLSSGSSSPAAAAPAASTTSSAPKPKLASVDESQPVTSLQIRLADGTRLVARFNHTHTIQDIRNFVEASRPSTGKSFQLQTTLPVTVLSDATKTIKDAGLLNAVVVQKYN